MELGQRMATVIQARTSSGKLLRDNSEYHFQHLPQWWPA